MGQAEQGSSVNGLADLDSPELVSRWLESLRQQSWKLRGPDASGPLELLRERCNHFITTLAEATRSGERPAAGAPTYREAVQSLSFTAGWMAGAGLPVTEAVALVHALEDVLDWPEADRFFRALMVVVTEAFASSVVQRERACYRDAMEKSQVVCHIHPRLPCLFLVGDPDRHALEDAVGRVMMLAVMRDARVGLVDGSALLAPELALPVAGPILAEHGEAASVHVVLGGVPRPLMRPLRDGVGQALTLYETYDEALGAALQRCGVAWSEGGTGSG